MATCLSLSCSSKQKSDNKGDSQLNGIFNNKRKIVLVLNPSDCIECILNLWDLQSFIKDKGFDPAKAVYVLPEVRPEIYQPFLQRLKVSKDNNIIDFSDDLVLGLKIKCGIKTFSSFYAIIDKNNALIESNYLKYAK